MSEPRIPPDQDQRDLILNCLDRNILVEAAAGTGKTTSMVGRMVALLARGECRIEHLAAVTFTRQAAAEMRGRFQIRLEQEAQAAEGETRATLVRSLDNLERCFMGTIHSFCARMLRERPVEAGVGVDFREVEEAEDKAFKLEAWAEYVTACHQNHDPILKKMSRLGMELRDLKDGFLDLTRFPDVGSWPVEPAEPPDLGPAVEALIDYGRHIRGLLPRLPRDSGNDKLIPKYRRLARMISQADLADPLQVVELLEEFCGSEPSAVKKVWPNGKEMVPEESARWNRMKEDHAEPVTAAWRRLRYNAALEALAPAVAAYDRLREEAALTFQDLLLRAAGLLKTSPRVRSYFRRRFTHILVDEFQDTDPVQAEVMLLLTAHDPAQNDWRCCAPAPGSLFVVGDPKQSIYRFRRADIVTYNQVKEIILKSGGLVASLRANFRTVAPVRDWVNSAFEQVFPQEADEFSPAYTPMEAGREEDQGAEPLGVKTIRIPRSAKNRDQAADYETGLIAARIRQAVDQGLELPRTSGELARGLDRAARPSDFMIISPFRSRLSLFASALSRAGLEHQVVGGTTVNDLDELGLLRNCLGAVLNPHDALALVGTLRGPLFGAGDPELFAFKQAGGVFDFRVEVPESLDHQIKALFADAFERLRSYSSWFRRLPPLAALERMVADLGLAALAGMDREGAMRAGALAKGMELLREWQSRSWTLAGLKDNLDLLLSGEPKVDGISAVWPEEPGVRIMNLHQAKGLEAPVVFLADPQGNDRKYPPTIHVDRSGEQSRGYLPFYQKSGFHKVRWADPPDWEEKKAREERFAQAEENRLLYVAATRAGSGLVVSQRESYKNRNRWQPLEKFLDGAEEMGYPAGDGPEEEQGPRIRPEGVAAQLAEIGTRWIEASRPSYSSGPAKALALTQEDWVEKGWGKGKEWGTVIHNLLEAAMLDPGADLHNLAAAFLSDQELSLEEAPEAVAQVRAVMDSEIWKRAGRADFCLAEAPFETLLEDQTEGGKVHVRGAIDLVFQEEGEYVIVDYKTDNTAGRDPSAILEKYRPQLEIYARAWSALTTQRVKEKGILLVKERLYLTL